MPKRARVRLIIRQDMATRYRKDVVYCFTICIMPPKVFYTMNAQSEKSSACAILPKMINAQTVQCVGIDICLLCSMRA